MFKRKQPTLEDIYGPTDPSDLLHLLERDLPSVIATEDPQKILEVLNDALSRFPLSHNLRLVAIASFHKFGLAMERDQVVIKSLLLYPESPILLKQCIRYYDGVFLPEELVSLQSRLNILNKLNPLDM